MNVLEQAKTLANKLSKNQKWILGTLISVVLIGVVALIVAIYDPPEQTVLYNNLEYKDASNVIGYLKSQKIAYETKNNPLDNTTTILVPQSRVEEIRMAVATQDLIQESTVGYELFDKTNLGTSEYVQQLNYRRALEGELQRTIKTNPEVRDVKVRLVIPKDKLFKQDQKPPTAAITLKLKSGHSLSRISVEGIQNSVAMSVEGMSPSNVVVTDNYGRILSQDIPDHNSLAGLSSTHQKTQKQFEDYLGNKVQELLDPVFGLGNSKIALNTDIDFDQLEVKIKDWDPDRQVERSEQTSTDDLTDLDTSFVPGTDMKHLKSNEIKNYEISSADSHFVKGIGAVKRLTITAIVNEKIEIQKTPTGLDTVVSIPRSDEELQRIENSIKNAVGYKEERGDQVNVLCVPFVEILADKITEVNEYNRQNSIQWYEKEEYQRLILLLLTLLITAIVMFKIIHAKFARDKMRIAMGLPAKLDKPILEKFDKELLEFPQEMEPEDEDDEDHYEEEVLEELIEEKEEEPLMLEDDITQEIMDDIYEDIDEIGIDDENMAMYLPDELGADQMFLESDLLNENDLLGLAIDDEDVLIPEQMSEEISLLDRARSALSSLEQPVQEDVINEEELIKMELRDKVMAFILGSPDIALKLFKVFYNQDNIE
ncbi:MAG: flagellar M-ring protein FliF [Bacteroidetes bacterium]|nr:flagellar M-ring protein FliF [Bacteroidota bacterium]